MRCLTLAEALGKEGAKVCFISRELPGDMIDHVEAKGFTVKRLPAPDSPPPEGPPTHARWAGVEWQRDAEETTTALGTNDPDWLVLDHYAFDDRWEKAVRRDEMKIMVIDDLADRTHACDLLLDQNLGRVSSDYKPFVPEHCNLMIGPRYALLRPEFAKLREKSLKRRQHPKLHRLMITLGGADRDNATNRVLDDLLDCPLPSGLLIEVVMGGNAPWLETVQEKALTMPWRTVVYANVSNIAQRMVEADLAIGASGSTSWERCCLALPTISLITAENQREAARALEQSGAIRIASSSDHSDSISETVRDLANNPESLKALSSAASEITDGFGSKRVLKCISEAV